MEVFDNHYVLCTQTRELLIRQQGQTEAAVLLAPTIGVLPRAAATTLGSSLSSMAPRAAAALRTTRIGCVLFVPFNKVLVISQNTPYPQE